MRRAPRPEKHSREVTRVMPGLFTPNRIRMIAAHAELAAGPAHAARAACTLRSSRRWAGSPGRRRTRSFSATARAQLTLDRVQTWETSASTSTDRRRRASSRRGSRPRRSRGERSASARTLPQRRFRDYTGASDGPKKPKAAAPSDAEVVDGELVDADEPVDVEPGEPDAAELADEDVPADDALPAVIDAADDDDEPSTTRPPRTRSCPSRSRPLAGAARSAAALHPGHPPLSRCSRARTSTSWPRSSSRPATSRRRAAW